VGATRVRHQENPVADNEISIELREGSGKGAARKLRASGRIPGVCYSRGAASTSISLDPSALDQLIKTSAAGINTLIDLKGVSALEGRPALVKALQRDPVRGNPLHADFYALDLARAIDVSVPVHLIGSAVGLLTGGIVDHNLRELELSCLPNAIPDEITLDVSALDIGDSLHVRDVPLPSGVELLSDPELSVVSVVAPAAAEEEAAPEAEEGEEIAEGEEGAEGATEAPADAGSAERGEDK
jgi:large subunit ribosomal protein L25